MTNTSIASGWDQSKLRFQSRVIRELIDVIAKFLDPETLGLAYGVTEEDVRLFAEAVLDDSLGADIERFVASDPAAKIAGGDANEYVLSAYKGVTAVLHYRVANALLYKNSLLVGKSDYRDALDQDGAGVDLDSNDTYFVAAARRISEQAAIQTTVEINPAARIAKGLVIDHGINVRIGVDGDSGVVVGETCEIGENCTILNGVVLGAAEVNTGAASSKRRHPKVGNDVTICAGVRVLGGITVGDGVWIGPGCIVAHDIPNGFRVQMLTELQYERPTSSAGHSDIRLYGLVPSGEHLLLYGNGLAQAELTVTDRFGEPVPGAAIRVLEIGSDCVRLDLETEDSFALPPDLLLEIVVGVRRFYLIKPPALFLAVERKRTRAEGRQT